ncbi:hypothetical protein L1049_028030 [Liquidambar formosana]|uniref:Uncharacterized protein n=1 Tax=Liquidambar formosana TaxID=63359 RepID=A0AAP0RKA3_LIQFO
MVGFSEKEMVVEACGLVAAGGDLCQRKLCRRSCRDKTTLWFGTQCLVLVRNFYSKKNNGGFGGIPEDYECEVIENDAPVPKHIPLHRPGPIPNEFYQTLEAVRYKKDEPAVNSGESQLKE